MVCISEDCPLYSECRQSAVNNNGLHIAEQFASYGSGYANENEIRSFYACGPGGGYRMYKEKEDSLREKA